MSEKVGSAPVTTDPDEAAAVLAAGGIVAIPTETVYGLAADATQPMAVERIFTVKGRPSDHPLILHVADTVDLHDVAARVPDTAQRLVEAFWPGPLSVIVSAADSVSRLATGGRDTVAVRCPDHDLTRSVLRRLGRAVVAPSANRFGRVSPTTPAHVAEDLGGDVDLILDGGRCRIGVESSIVDCTVDPPQLLRPGGVSAEAIEKALAQRLADAQGPVRAPGMLESHYAPSCRILLEADAMRARRRVRDEVASGRRVELLDPQVTEEMWAHHLYEWLREADGRDLDLLVVVPPPGEGLAAAVRDRLSRAAAGR